MREQAKLLWRPVLEETGHPDVVAALAGIVGEMPPDAQRDPTRLTRAVQRWVQSNVRYLREYPERYQRPTRTLKWRVGDCDDMAPLVATMLRTARVPARLRFGGWGLQPGERPIFRHVYAQALLPRGWTTAETVRAVPLGFDAVEWKRAKGLEVKHADVGDRGPL